MNERVHSQLQFDNRFVRSLPADPESRNFRRQVSAACYSRVLPQSVRCPQLVAWNAAIAQELGFAATDVDAEWLPHVFGGNRLLAGMDPFAMCYGGHQFGQWAGQLGDGRAINLGEVRSRSGQHWMLQLKGAGPTPYSRTADGLAVLRSSVREYLCSEAMHALGVPTTRALSLVLTGEQVVRDMFYDGNPQAEPGAIVCRVAPTFLRFGNYEIFSARGDVDNLRRLADFTLETHFPELGVPARETYLAWFTEVCRRTALMIVEWMRVGFVHGVMNTDNMSILGLTIDYGPYGWLEGYDPQWTPNTTDAMGRRYCFGQQPQIGLWNLVQLANTLWPIVEDKPGLEGALAVYSETFKSGYRAMIARKLGLAASSAADDSELIEELFKTLQLVEVDYTLFFRGLAEWQNEFGQLAGDLSSELEVYEPTSQRVQAASDSGLPIWLGPLAPAFYRMEPWSAMVERGWSAWLQRYRERLQRDSLNGSQRRTQMNAVNPKFVLRNYLAQQAIDAATQGDFTAIERLYQVMQHPYDEQPEAESFANKRPEWARHRAGCSMLSCSS